MGKTYREIWGEYGHAFPEAWLVPTDVTVRHSSGERETLRVMMLSRNEWKGRIKRVVALRHDLNESAFEVLNWKVVYDENE